MIARSAISSMTRLALILGTLVCMPVAVRAQDHMGSLVIHPAPRPMPEVTFEDADGTKHGLIDFKGKVVLLNLWATWCVPCRQEMPTLDRLQARFGGPGFEVVAVSIDRTGLKAVNPFFESTGVRHLAPYLDTSGRMARAVGALGLPTTLLIDRDGQEIGRAIGALEWDSPTIVEQIRPYLPDHREQSTGDKS